MTFNKLLPEEERSELSKVLTRSWIMGDIITAIGTAGLFIRIMEEIPGNRDPRYPEFYTIIADKV